MNFCKQYIRKHWFGICVFSILIIAAILRFYNYENRWGLAYDQARDVLVAREALHSHSIPLIGPFSSAGQFVYGPWWFWILMGMVSVYPYSVITPWVIQTLLYVGIVGLMIIIGKDLQDKRFGLVVGILTAISTAQLAQSTNLTSPSMVGVLTVVVVYMLIKYLKTERAVFAFLLGLSIDISVNVHFQAVGLLVLLPFAIFFGRKDIKRIMSLIIGAIIPFIPIVIFDLISNFFESKNMLRYYLHDQDKIPYEVLGRRWLTYTGVFWPKAWGHVIGGDSITGYVQIAVLAIVGVYGFLKKIIPKEIYMVGISFLIMFFLIRYTRTPLFDSYLMFMNPFIFILTGWIIFILIKKKTTVGIAFAMIIVAGSLVKDIQEIKAGSNFSAIEAIDRVKKLKTLFPNQKFSVYDYKYKWADKNLILSLYLDTEGKIDDSGRRIGIVVATRSGEFAYPIILGDKEGYQLLDLESSSSSELSRAEWAKVNPKDIYLSTQEWYSKK